METRQTETSENLFLCGTCGKPQPPELRIEQGELPGLLHC